MRLRAAMAAPRRPRNSGVWPGSAAMHVSHRTWRWFVTGPPQSGQLHAGVAGFLPDRWRGAVEVAACRAEAFRAFTTAWASRLRVVVSGVLATYLPAMAWPRA